MTLPLLSLPLSFLPLLLSNLPPPLPLLPPPLPSSLHLYHSSQYHFFHHYPPLSTTTLPPSIATSPPSTTTLLSPPLPSSLHHYLSSFHLYHSSLHLYHSSHYPPPSTSTTPLTTHTPSTSTTPLTTAIPPYFHPCTIPQVASVPITLNSLQSMNERDSPRRMERNKTGKRLINGDGDGKVEFIKKVKKGKYESQGVDVRWGEKEEVKWTPRGRQRWNREREKV
ncbi:hypothetical protein Pcinc_023327 [Petrolisthes cinctipes]|uniref:Uncharacterized protein n=1 Tax=Petrolisthes cinctipes TaxID=88211 RepID=A0AAE1FCJ2_PETCI|nr:hypothetical protein Pcinc_023327 [Petrolisthes cinctipes]